MIKNIIFYFSGTGNTQFIAQELAQKQQNTLIIPISKYKSYIIDKEYDSIGFIYPTYYAGMPNVMVNFINNLEIKTTYNYMYVLSSHGAIYGNSIRMGVQLLRNKGYNIDYAASIKSFSNYIIWHDITDEAFSNPDKYDNKLYSVINDIISRKKVKIKKEFFIFKQWYTFESKKAKIRDSNFRINDDCIKCNLCKDNCPVNNITNKDDGFLIFNNNCEQCLACIHHCPKQAINYLDKTAKRKRYLNKRIILNELNNEKRY